MISLDNIGPLVEKLNAALANYLRDVLKEATEAGIITAEQADAIVAEVGPQP